MQVLFDFQAFIRQKYGGVSRYFAELMAEFSEMPQAEIDVRLSCGLSNNTYLRDCRYFSGRPFFPAWDSSKKFKIMNVLGKHAAAKVLRQGKFDVLHPTYFDPYFLKHIGSKRFVVTVHDMIHEIHPEFFFLKDRTNELKKRVVEQADRIIAVSENTKADFLRIFPIGEEKVDVVHHGVPRLVVPDSVRSRFEGRYLLYVGNRDGYKNFKFAMAALAPWLKDRPDFSVACCGGKPFSRGEVETISRFGLDGRVVQSDVTDMELMAAYRDAECFIFPSLYEGFGMPILEAAGNGCPMLLAETSCLPEIAGDGAVYFAAGDEDAFRSGLESLVVDREFRAKVVERAFENLERFSWKATAAKTLEVYRKALQR